MRKLHIMSGLPASGKSTYCEMIGREHGDVIIHRDEVRNHLRELLDSEEYFPCDAATEYEFYMAHVRAAVDGSERDIWIDQTTLSAGALTKLLSALDKVIDLKEFYISVEVLDTPYEVCLERNAAREGFLCVPEKTMQSMRNGFYIPPIFIYDDKTIQINYIEQEGAMVRA